MVRLIGDDGQQLGIIAIDEARRMAAEAGLDLVEVAANADPPVARVMDYGKYKYQQSKKAQEGKKKQSQTQVKEIKFRPKIEDHDFGFKLRKILDFLGDHNRVKVTVRFRGREIAYMEAGFKLLERVVEEIGEAGVLDREPAKEGRTLTMYLAPK
jgi:translation initiation factor IF-3